MEIYSEEKEDLKDEGMVPSSTLIHLSKYYEDSVDRDSGYT